MRLIPAALDCHMADGIYFNIEAIQALPERQ